MNAASAIEQLQAVGFEFSLSHGYPDEEIRYSYKGNGRADTEKIRLLLQSVKQYRNAAVEVLRVRKAHLAWIEVWDQWTEDDNPENDTVHANRLATAAIIGKLPFYEDGENDAGPDAWRLWARQYAKSETTLQEEVMPMRARDPRPLPWETH